MNRNGILARIAPILRGTTFDGAKGAFGRSVPLDSEASAGSGTRHRPSGALRLNRLDPERVVPLVEKEQWSGLAEAVGAAAAGGPDGLEIPGVGVLLPGGDFDRIEELERSYRNRDDSPVGERSGKVRPEDAGSSALRGIDRSDVVRGRIALVTGGAQGFGGGLVEELAERGCFCWIAEEVALTTGGLDLLVSNAGILRAGGVRELSLRDFRSVTDVNYLGYFLAVKHFSPIMSLQNIPTGRYFTDIVQINSKSGLAGSNRNGAYAGSKFGGIGLTQSFALELVEDNIKVNEVCPGNFFDGPLWSDPEKGLFVQYLRAGKVPGAKTVEDVRRFYEAKVPMKRGCGVQDVMRAVLYLVEQQYETGQALPVTGGQVMLA